MKFVCLYLLITGVALLGCKREHDYYDGVGKKPVYIPESELDNIQNVSPRAVENAGTIYLLNPYLFMVEQKKGIHVFEVSDTSNPVNLTFIQVPAINDFTINGNSMFVDNGPNLVSLDMSDIMDVRVLAKVKNAFQPILYPTMYLGPFECGDEKKGIIVEWKDTMLVNAKCWSN
jgi:hypothetical protein